MKRIALIILVIFAYSKIAIATDVIEKNVLTGETTERSYTQEELDNITAAIAEGLPQKIIRDALDTQIESEKTALPTWTQVAIAIDNAFPDTAQATIIKKIARPVYTYLKNSVD